MEALSASAFFGGSNALWRTAVLRGFTFSTGVQTEDIDVSARAMLNNHNIVCHAGPEPWTSRGPQAGPATHACEPRLGQAFCAESRSGELSPSDLGSLYRQRLRWAIGWDQVTL